MRAVIQKVISASCTVDNKVVSSIDKGYMILLGFTHTDTLELIDKFIKKIVKLRIFEDENMKLNKSILDVNGSILLISQFTLYGDVKDGNRPSFTEAMKYDIASNYYDIFSEKLNEFVPTKKGIFGADMKIALVNDGPVTIIIDSDKI